MESFLNNLISNTSIFFIVIGALLFVAAFILYLIVKTSIIKFIPTDADITNRRSIKKKYNDYLKSPEWEKLKNTALKKANNICELCGKSAHVVHHKSYPGNFKNDNLDNLLVLCNKCHYKIHKKQIEYRKKDTLFSDSVLSGKQHFRIEVKEAINQSKYVVITELRADEQGRSDDIKIIIFENNLEKVNSILHNAINYIKSTKNTNNLA